MKRIRIIAVGRIRTPYWQAAAEEYQKRLGHVYRLDETIIRDGSSSLSAQARNAVEGERILSALSPSEHCVRLDERGECMDSPAFSRYIAKLCDTGKAPCFIVGGAYGFSPALAEAVPRAISFGPMTFPHELARVLLLEQLYRADAIARGNPYHHA